MLVFVGAMIPFASVFVSVEISLVAEVDIETPSERDTGTVASFWAVADQLELGPGWGNRTRSLRPRAWLFVKESAVVP
jgi:hypothetical protein